METTNTNTNTNKNKNTNTNKNQTVMETTNTNKNKNKNGKNTKSTKCAIATVINCRGEEIRVNEKLHSDAKKDLCEQARSLSGLCRFLTATRSQLLERVQMTTEEYLALVGINPNDNGVYSVVDVINAIHPKMKRKLANGTSTIYEYRYTTYNVGGLDVYTTEEQALANDRRARFRPYQKVAIDSKDWTVGKLCKVLKQGRNVNNEIKKANASANALKLLEKDGGYVNVDGLAFNTNHIKFEK